MHAYAQFTIGFVYKSHLTNPVRQFGHWNEQHLYPQADLILPSLHPESRVGLSYTNELWVEHCHQF